MATGPLIVVELGSRLARYGSDGEHLALHQLLERRLAELCTHTGLTVSPAVAVMKVEDARAVRIRVDGQVRPYSLSMFRRAWLTVAPEELRSVPLDASPTDPAVYPDVWLDDVAASSNPEFRTAVTEYLARLTTETLALHPSCLLSWAAINEYLRPGECAHSDDRAPDELDIYAKRVFSRLLDLGIALRPRELVRRLVHGWFDADGTVTAAVEEVFARLSRDEIEVRVNPRYLSALGIRLGGKPHAIDDETLPESLRESGSVVSQHLVQLGAGRPIVLVEASSVRLDEIQIRMNDYVGLPIPIPDPDETVVHAAPWKLGFSGGRALLDAASGHRVTALRKELSTLEAAGFAMTPAATFLAVAVGREVLPLAYRLITLDDAERELASFWTEFPTLVEASLDRVRAPELTSLLRWLVRERVATRDLWSILNALLRFDGERALDTDEHGEMVSFLRRELAIRVAYDSGAGLTGDRLDVYETEPELEELLTRFDENDDGEQIRATIRETLFRSHAPADAILLTADATRRALRKLLEHEFPSIYVLARGEIAPNVVVRRVAAIHA